MTSEDFFQPSPGESEGFVVEGNIVSEDRPPAGADSPAAQDFLQSIYADLGADPGGPAGDAPVGHTIQLNSSANGKYVTAAADKPDTPLLAKVDWTPGGWTEFAVEDAGSGRIRLKAVVNNKWVRADPGETDTRLEASVSQNPGGWTEFTWEDVGGGTIRLIANTNGNWVRADLDETDSPLQAEVDWTPGGWTEFTWDDLGLT